MNYGYGYYGRGYEGGRWRGRKFEYNTAITHVNRTIIRNVYYDCAVANNHWNHVSYNGGRGGITARPTASEQAFQRGKHFGPTHVQMQHARFAATNHAAFSSANHGRPVTATVARPYTTAIHHPAARSVQATRPSTHHLAAP
ncbi:MAG TPA: hypothetical protein VIK27_11765, partial [Candidatus Aquilonibacter sp.]